MKVKTITIGRLFNLGSYEHVRYEVSVELGDGDSPAESLKKLEEVLTGLSPKCPVSDFDLARAREYLKKPIGELDKWELQNLECYKNRIAEFEKWESAKASALKTFEQLGGQSKYTDDKLNWDDSQD